MICIQYGLGSLFPFFNPLDNFTAYKDVEKEKYIYYFYLDTYLNFASFYCHINLYIGVFMLLVLLYHSHYI